MFREDAIRNRVELRVKRIVDKGFIRNFAALGSVDEFHHALPFFARQRFDLLDDLSSAHGPANYCGGGGAARFSFASSHGSDARVFTPPALPQRRAACYFPSMSVLELKQELSRMSKRDRQELHAYLIRLMHETPEWKKAAARRVTEMKKGRVVTGADLQARIGAR